ncbi:hypothetical protein T01_12179 [Trichinella spiralis]|uniref:Uncharacterized protein n=1 Tax=Trichinella spiralis TaxID=6334 RepID=A0A0V0ZFS0_TRISP|nr:hypothetical protein T01_12179 [Trichinella spiralis]
MACPRRFIIAFHFFIEDAGCGVTPRKRYKYKCGGRRDINTEHASTTKESSSSN